MKAPSDDEATESLFEPGLQAMQFKRTCAAHDTLYSGCTCRAHGTRRGHKPPAPSHARRVRSASFVRPLSVRGSVTAHVGKGETSVELAVVPEHRRAYVFGTSEPHPWTDSEPRRFFEASYETTLRQAVNTFRRRTRTGARRFGKAALGDAGVILGRMERGCSVHLSMADCALGGAAFRLLAVASPARSVSPGQCLAARGKSPLGELRG